MLGLLSPNVANAAAGGAVVVTVLMLAYGVGLLIYWAVKKAQKAAEPKVKHLRKTTLPKVGKFAAKTGAAISNRGKTDEEKVLEIEDEYFEAAANEISQNTPSKGLWLKSLALAEGDETKQKAIYIRLRAKQLSDVPPRDDTESSPNELDETERLDDLVHIIGKRKSGDRQKPEAERLRQQRLAAELKRLDERRNEELLAIEQKARERKTWRFVVFSVAIVVAIFVWYRYQVSLDEKQASDPPRLSWEEQNCAPNDECYDPD